MTWKLKSWYEEDCTVELLTEPSDAPFIGFLKFAIQNGERYALRMNVIRHKGKKHIKEISFKFKGLDEQVVSMSHLTLMGRKSWMEDTVRLLESLDDHKEFKVAKMRYEGANRHYQNAKVIVEKYEGTPLETDHSIKERMAIHQNTMTECTKRGAFFPDYVKTIYRDYLHELKHPSKSVEVTHEKHHDHIEVELLTILNDKEVAQEVKVEAGVTLTRYREKKEAEKTPEENQKNSNALIAIKTIQEHYLK